MFKGFREFISRGSVVDLAVGVVVGAAFTTVVNQFTMSFLTPLINLIGGVQFGGKIKLNATQSITWGAFLSAIIGFAITAAVVYFLVVVPMNKLAERRKRGEMPEPSAPGEEILLLQEIRDLLARQTAGDEPVKQRTAP